MGPGERNSSITRVWPVFRALLARDPTGQSWIPSLLALAPVGGPMRNTLTRQLVPLGAQMKETRRFTTKQLARYLPNGMLLERCFERELPPPGAFLRWLASHPKALTWSGKALDDDKPTGRHRQALAGRHGPEAQRQAIEEALVAIEAFGARGSGRRWWAFEGFTSADCCLESENALFIIEGKRTDVIAAATDWYPQRNQIVRNLEVGEAAAAGRSFGVIVINETGHEPLTTGALTKGLPHLSSADRSRLAGHYLGAVSWAQACRATGIDEGRLPETVQEALLGRG